MIDYAILDKIENDLNRYHKMYDAIRIFDPVGKMVIARSGKVTDKLENIVCGYWKIT